jgi:hypothetical protein
VRCGSPMCRQYAPEPAAFGHRASVGWQPELV